MINDDCDVVARVACCVLCTVRCALCTVLCMLRAWIVYDDKLAKLQHAKCKAMSFEWNVRWELKTREEWRQDVNHEAWKPEIWSLTTWCCTVAHHPTLQFVHPVSLFGCTAAIHYSAIQHATTCNARCTENDAQCLTNGNNVYNITVWRVIQLPN